MIPHFSVRDLLVTTTILATNLAIVPLAVAHTDAWWTTLVFIIPTACAVWIHLRFRLSLPVAAGTHYVVSLVWSFTYGLAFCAALNAHNAANPTHGRTFLPVSWAIDDMQEMAVFGVVTSALYLAIGYAFSALYHWLRLCFGGES